MGMVARNVATQRRRAEIAARIVNLRTLPHAEGRRLAATHVVLEPTLLYPVESWNALQHHERRWLMAYAAAMASRGAVACGRSAARLWGMWVVGPDREPVELALPSRGKSAGRVARGRVYRRSGMRPDEIDRVDGQLATSPFRTFADIARYHGFAEGLIAADFLMRHGFTRGQLEAEARCLGRVKGIATVRRCIACAVANSESPYESLARALLIDANLGPLTTQAPIAGYFADILIDGWLIIEIDGAVKYSGPDAERVRQREFQRQKDIGNLGFVFLRFTPEQLRRDPEGFVAAVRETLASHGRLAARG